MIHFKKLRQSEEGSALVSVLIFVTVSAIWLTSALLIVQVSADVVNSAIKKREEASASAEGMAWALSRLQDPSITAGVGSSANCGLGVIPVTLDVTCEPATADDVITQPLDSLILTLVHSSDSALVIDRKTAGSGSQNIDLNLDSGLRINNGKIRVTNPQDSVTVRGTIRTNSGGGTNCSSSLSSSVTSSNCVTGSTDSTLQTINNGTYFRSLVEATASRPAVAIPPQCSSSSLASRQQTGGSYTVGKGKNAPVYETINVYMDITVGMSINSGVLSPGSFLNSFSDTAGVFSYVEGNNCGRFTLPSATATIPGATPIPVYFRQNAIVTMNLSNGIYYFEGSRWDLDGTSSITVGNSAEAVTDKTDLEIRNQGLGGVQMVFIGNSGLDIGANTSFVTTPFPYKKWPRLSVVMPTQEMVDLSSSRITARLNPNNNKDNKGFEICEICVGQANVLTVSGMVVAPDGDVSLDYKGSSGNPYSFENGIIARTLTVLANPRPKISPIRVQAPKIDNGSRKVKLTIRDKKSGKTLSTATVVVLDEYGTAKTPKFEVIK